MSEAIVVTSGKGGVGKTVLTANIGAGLAKLDKKTVMIDMDTGLRNLDVAAGMENRVMYNLIDVLEGSCPVEQALIQDTQEPNLFLLPTAQLRDKSAVSPEQMKELVAGLKETGFDYILLDCPSGMGQGFRSAAAAADRALLITSTEVTAVRDADRMKGLLEEQGIRDIALIFNRIRMDLIEEGSLMSVEEVLDLFALDKIGVIPEDDHILIASNQGVCVAGDASIAGTACMNICRRILGEEVAFLNLRTRKGFFENLKKRFS